MNHYEVQALAIAFRVWPDDSAYAFAKGNGWMEEAKAFAQIRRKESCALLLEKLDQKVGQAFKERNGDLIIAICRHGKVKTIMLRRSNQDNSPSALGVDERYGWGG